MTALAIPGSSEIKRARPRRHQRNVPLIAGLTLLGLIVLAVICAPLLTHWDPIQQDLVNARSAPGTPGHPLGTDELGRDVWSRLLYGGRIDLVVGFLAVIAPFIIGTTFGLISGWFGGWGDTLTMRTVDVLQFCS